MPWPSEEGDSAGREGDSQAPALLGCISLPATPEAAKWWSPCREDAGRPGRSHLELPGLTGLLACSPCAIGSEGTRLPRFSCLGSGTFFFPCCLPCIRGFVLFISVIPKDLAQAGTQEKPSAQLIYVPSHEKLGHCDNKLVSELDGGPAQAFPGERTSSWQWARRSSCNPLLTSPQPPHRWWLVCGPSAPAPLEPL